MAMTRYNSTRFVEIILDGNSMELEVALEFTIQPFVKAQGQSYASGGQPAEGGHVEDVWCKAITREGEDWTQFHWLKKWVEESADLDALYNEAIEYEAYARDSAADAKYQEMRDEGRA